MRSLAFHPVFYIFASFIAQSWGMGKAQGGGFFRLISAILADEQVAHRHILLFYAFFDIFLFLLAFFDIFMKLFHAVF